MIRAWIRWVTCAALCAGALLPGAAAAEGVWRAGAARVDITPEYPIRLTGYAARKTESEGVAQRLYARALALAGAGEGPALIITVDNCGVPAGVRDEVAARLKSARGFPPERLAVCSTHTHSAPWVRGFAPNIFGAPIPPDQQERVDRYTRELTDALEKVALGALDHLRPARVSQGRTQAGFAANRRTKGGPVDHELPVLAVTDTNGTLCAMFATYACHCTTLGGDFNQICGDWAGYAAEDLERDHPGTVALIGLGCGGDANPAPRSTLELAKQHGGEIAAAVNALLTNSLAALTGELVCRTERIELPFDTAPSRAEWEALSRQTNYVGSHARLNLARLDRGEKLPTRLPYLVQSWVFGDDFAMLFLPGEVVVDYSLRLKHEYAPGRLWLTAYANDVPCYIPSERVLKEGGYEGGGAMIYYDRPARFAPGVEERIITAAERLLPKKLLAQP